MNTEAAENGAADVGGMFECKKRGNARAHRVPYDVGAGEPEMVKQCTYVRGHKAAVIIGRIVKLARLAVPAVVERDRTLASFDKRGDPARMDPVHMSIGGKAVHEHD